MKTFKQFNEWLLKSKNKQQEMMDLTEPHRDLIRKHFSKSNVDMKFSKEGNYVIPKNANAVYGNKEISFRNEGGKLKASVAHYRGEVKGIPVTHTDHEISSSEDIEKIKNL